MEKLPNELIYMIVENLARGDLARLSRASRTHRRRLEVFLYSLHALPETTGASRQRAVICAVDIAHSDKPEAQATALAILDKVARFCHVSPATLDYCCQKKLIFGWIGSDSMDRLRLSRAHRPRIERPYLTPLHVATLKGLDDVVAWLLGQGASIDAPVLGTHITALCLAVLADRILTALLLLVHRADPHLPVDGNNARQPPTVLHLACALGRATMCERLMASQHVEADPAELLCFYQDNCKEDVPALVQALVRQGAEISDDQVEAFVEVGKLQSAAELLAAPAFHEGLTADRASGLLWAVMVRCGVGLLVRHVETFRRMLQLLVDRGANVNMCRCLWSWMAERGYPTMLQLVQPLLEAGMYVGPPPPKPKKRKRGRTPPPPAHYGMNDLLGDISPYDNSQDEEGAAAQLAIVRLLLQHGAPIEGATRGDALDAYPRAPDENWGRGRWAYRLCQVLLDHCRDVPEDRRGKDIDVFLSRYADAKSRTRSGFVQGL